MRYLFLITAMVLLASASQAQRGRSDTWKKYRHEVGLSYGYNSTYFNLGDNDGLGVRPFLQRSTFSGHYRFFIFKFLSVKGTVAQAYARKNDKVTDQDERPTNLRIDYKTSVTEFSGVVEFHLFDELARQKSGQRRARGGLQRGLPLGLSAYAGISYGLFRPKGEYFGDEVELRPLNSNPGVDPVTASYDRSHLHIPVGLNVRYIIDKSWRLGIDFGYRFGFRSYIDNISGVYYKDLSTASDPGLYEDRSFVGFATFGDSDESSSELRLNNGRNNYFMAMISLSYRIKL